MITHTKIQFLLLGLALCLVACKKKDEPQPLSEQIQHVWKAQAVKHNSTVVYTAGSSSNIVASYADFRLDLSQATQVTLIEVDGTTFTGRWALSADSQKLILSNLTPQPTGTGGTLEYAVSTRSNETLGLTRLTISPKTGNTVNEYTLVPN